jgi:pyruvate/2-oxoglutarate dehydrogenase complex dihydrolipoamide acyltransferase (E2) component
LIPLPSRVWAPFELQPYNAASVYVEVAGRLVEIGARPGDRVAAGDLIARLENHDLEFQAAQLEGERASLRSQEEGLRTLMYTPSRSEDAANKLTVVTETLAGVENRLRQLKSDLARLTITAPKAGVVIPAPRVPERPEEEDVELPTWTGTPLDERNIGATLTPESQQNLLCQVGDPNQWEAVLVIDQDDVDFVQHGQEVRLMFDESAYHVFVSKVAKPPESGDAMTVAPRSALRTRRRCGSTIRSACCETDSSVARASKPDRARSASGCTCTSAARSTSTSKPGRQLAVLRAAHAAAPRWCGGPPAIRLAAVAASP